MRKFLITESFFFRSPRIWIPFASLGVVMFFPALLSYWSGSVDHLRGPELAAYASGSSLNSSITGFFFVLWMIQHFVHLIQTGFYKSILCFGASRTALFLYGQFQLCLYVLFFLVIGFLANSFAGLFFSVWPWQVITNTDYNSVVAQLLFLFTLGNLAALLAYSKPGHLVLLPLLFYWFLEGWIVSQSIRKWDMDFMAYLPLNSLKAIIGEALMEWPQLLATSIYLTLVVVLLHFKTLKRVLV